MKNLYLLIFLLSASFSGFAQVTEQVSVGTSYAQSTYYRLSDGQTTSSEHTSWDIAFGVDGFSAAVFVNEAVGLSFGPPLPITELYLTSAFDFASIDTVGMTRIYNDEASWGAGAFNHVQSPGSPLDLGWGEYNPATQQVTSLRFFVIKPRDNSYKKLEIQSLIGGVYTFRYANLDGSNEVVKTITKAEFEGKTLVYYSFATESIVDLEPDQWDMVFTRYITPLDDGAGGTIDYTLTGVLTNENVTVAQADGIDPNTVDYANYENVMSDSVLTIIGHDWKSFQGGWSLPADRVYFVKSAEDEIWKLQFIDFEGSSTGVTTLTRTFMSTITSLNEQEFEHLTSFNVFPNPASDHTHVAFEIKNAVRTGQLQIFNSTGQILSKRVIDIQNGLNVIALNLDYPAGLYFMSVQVGADLLTQRLMIH